MMNKKKLLFGIVGGIIGGVVGGIVSLDTALNAIGYTVYFLENWIPVTGRVNLLLIIGITTYLVKIIFIIVGLLIGVFLYKKVTSRTKI